MHCPLLHTINDSSFGHCTHALLACMPGHCPAWRSTANHTPHKLLLLSRGLLKLADTPLLQASSGTVMGEKAKSCSCMSAFWRAYMYTEWKSTWHCQPAHCKYTTNHKILLLSLWFKIGAAASTGWPNTPVQNCHLCCSIVTSCCSTPTS